MIGEVEPERWPADLTRSSSDAARSTRPQSYLELMAELSSARAFVGNDSGPGHLAGILGVPTLALFGPTDPRGGSRWAAGRRFDRAARYAHGRHVEERCRSLPRSVRKCSPGQPRELNRTQHRKPAGATEPFDAWFCRPYGAFTRFTPCRTTAPWATFCRPSGAIQWMNRISPKLGIDARQGGGVEGAVAGGPVDEERLAEQEPAGHAPGGDVEVLGGQVDRLGPVAGVPADHRVVAEHEVLVGAERDRAVRRAPSGCRWRLLV